MGKAKQEEQEGPYKPPFAWSPKTKKYLDADGKVVPDVCLRGVEKVVEVNVKADIHALTEQFKNEEIELLEWQESLKRLIKNYRLSIFALRNGGFENAKKIGYDSNQDDIYNDFTRLNDISQEVSETDDLSKITDTDVFFAELFAISSITPLGDPREASASTFLAPSQMALIAEASNFGGDRDLHRSLMLKHLPDIWQTNENEGFKYHNGKTCTVIYQPSELFSEDWYYSAREQTLQALDSRLMQMRSELTADVIDILFHHWRTSPKKDKDKALITLAQICEYRGVQAGQVENLRDAWQAMRDARSIRLTGEAIDASLFDMDAMPGVQRRLWPIDEPPALDVGYIYSPGYFLSKAIAENPIYVAPYLRKVWELRPHHDGKAKRLARYLRSEWRMNTGAYLRPKGAAPARYRTWGNILEDAGIVPEEWESKKPRRFIDEIEKAMSTLYDIEVIADVSAGIYHPEDRRLYENLPRKGALQAFLSLRVCIDPAADIADALRGTHQKRVARAAQLKALPDGAKPKRGRKKPI